MGVQKTYLLNSPVILQFSGGITPRGAYDNLFPYATGDSVSYLGSSYVAIQATSGNLPTDTTYWQILAEKGDDGVGGEGGGSGDMTKAVYDPTNVEADAFDYNNFSNKPTIPNELADLADDATHRIVTDAEKTAWNAKYGSGDSPTFADLTITGLGGNLITTESVETSIEELDDALYALNDSGFGAWTSGTDGTTYTLSGGTFTLDRAGYGYINSKKITWASGQSVGSFSANTFYWIYIDSAGLIQKTSTFIAGTIRLFELLYDGTIYMVAKENHPIGFDQSVSGYLHNNAGTTIRGTGAIITRVAAGTGAANGDREVKIVGADTIDDHGLSTTIPDSAGAGVTWNVFYRNASGKWVRDSQVSQLPIKYNNAGTPTALDVVNAYAEYVLYVAKDDIENSAPQYVAVMGESSFTTLAAVLAAITGGSSIFATNELKSVEAAQLGYAVVQYSATGGYVEEVIVAKSTFNQQLVGGSAATDHGLLSGLDHDDHTQYASLDGRSGGQTLKGDTASGGNLTLESTDHATKGKILLGDSAYDEATGCLGIGTQAPASAIAIEKSGALVDIKNTLNTSRAAFHLSNAIANRAGFFFYDDAYTSGAFIGNLRVYMDVITGNKGHVLYDNINKLGIKTSTPTYDVSIGGNADRTIGLERITTTNVAGKKLTVSSGGATPAGAVLTITGTPVAGGSGYTVGDYLTLAGGTGATAYAQVVDGSGAVTTAKLALAGKGYSVATVATSGGTGTGCTIAVATVTTCTDKNGGDLILTSGDSVGTGSSNVLIKTAPAGSTGSADNAATTKVTVNGDGDVAIVGDVSAANLSGTNTGDQDLSTLVPKAGATMTGALIADDNTNYTTAQMRNVILSTGDPTGGQNGDLWIKYVA